MSMTIIRRIAMTVKIDALGPDIGYSKTLGASHGERSHILFHAARRDAALRIEEPKHQLITCCVGVSLKSRIPRGNYGNPLCANTQENFIGSLVRRRRSYILNRNQKPARATFRRRLPM
jgi:hypothetical protein